jgi:hypothetical protein
MQGVPVAMLKALLPVAIIGSVAVAACKSASISAPSASVSFVFAPQTCSSIVPVHFSIDGIEVGVDTFRVAVNDGDHLTSHAFAVSPGQHSLGARTDRFTWTSVTVALAAGQAFTDSLPFYCS